MYRVKTKILYVELYNRKQKFYVAELELISIAKYYILTKINYKSWVKIDMKLIIPIDNLIFDSIIGLGNVILIPPIAIKEGDYEFDENLLCYEKQNIQEFINKYEKFINHCAEMNISLSWLDIGKFDENIDKKLFLEDKCNLVNRSLDYIRISYCRFDIKDTLPGTPGIIDLKKIGFLIDVNNWKMETIIGNKQYFNLQQGLGLEFNLRSPKLTDPKLYNNLFSDRKDEVYIEFRTILARASQSMHINDINRCFSYLFSTLERMGSREYKIFEKRKRRIIGWISKDQEEYDILNRQFFFFSKVVRTKIIHEGKDILEIIPVEKAMEIIKLLYLAIYRFANGVIESDIQSFDKLDQEIDIKASRFIKNSIKDIIDYDNYECIDYTVGNAEAIIIPIDNLEMDSIIKLGETIVVPKNYSRSLKQESNLEGAINLELIKDIFNDSSVVNLNNKVAVAIFKCHFKRESDWYADKEFYLLDLLCKKVDRAMNYIILSKCNIRNQDKMPGISGIYNRFRYGQYFNIEERVINPILGRVFKLYNKSDNALILENFIPSQEDKILYDCLYSERSDEVIVNCREALSRICEAMYITNYTISLTYLFDTVDMLDPTNSNINISIKHALHFLCKSKLEYYSLWNELKTLSENFRTPLLHHGKNIYDIVSTEEEIYGLFNKISNLIVDYCKVVFSTGITQFSKLDEERRDRIKKIGIA